MMRTKLEFLKERVDQDSSYLLSDDFVEAIAFQILRLVEPYFPHKIGPTEQTVLSRTELPREKEIELYQTTIYAEQFDSESIVILKNFEKRLEALDLGSTSCALVYRLLIDINTIRKYVHDYTPQDGSSRISAISPHIALNFYSNKQQKNICCYFAQHREFIEKRNQLLDSLSLQEIRELCVSLDTEKFRPTDYETEIEFRHLAKNSFIDTAGHIITPFDFENISVDILNNDIEITKKKLGVSISYGIPTHRVTIVNLCGKYFSYGNTDGHRWRFTALDSYAFDFIKLLPYSPVNYDDVPRPHLKQVWEHIILKGGHTFTQEPYEDLTEDIHLQKNILGKFFRNEYLTPAPLNRDSTTGIDPLREQCNKYKVEYFCYPALDSPWVFLGAEREKEQNTYCNIM